MYLRICAVVTLIATAFGLLVFIAVLATASSAPQQAAGAAIAVATCVIPYIHMRTVEIGNRLDREKERASAPAPQTRSA